MDDVKRRSGENFIYSFKEGQTRKDYFYDNNLIQTRIYQPKSNLNSMFYPDWDTLYQYTPHGKDFKLVEYAKIADTVIDGKTLAGIRTGSKFLTKEVPNLVFTYYFDSTLKINPAWFKESKEGNWDQLMTDKKSLPYLYIIDDRIKYKQIFKASEVKYKNISDSKFDLPNLAVQKLD